MEFLRRRSRYRAAVDFLDGIERSPRVQVVAVRDDDERRAWRWLRQHDERDFAAAGFVELRTI